MKEKLSIEISRDGWFFNRKRNDKLLKHQVYGQLVRISPTSYRRGEESGFVLGVTIGWVIGLLTMCLVVAIINP